MSVQAIIGDHSLVFGSQLAQERFYELKGQAIEIHLDNRPSSEMRRFFEGTVVPYVFYQSGGAWANFRECREALKLEFLPGWTRNLHGERAKFPRSTTELSKEGFRRFLEEVLRWMEEQGMKLPDAEDFRRWRDSAPTKGELYLPLK